MARLLSLNVAMPADVEWQGRTVHTGIFKQPVAGPRMARTLNIDGDGQGDLAGHGGENRAVLVYQRQSYEYWRTQLQRDDLEYGRFGENFTVDGLSDGEVCIGDRYRIGDAEFEVTQPRVTCYRVGMSLQRPDMAALLVVHHRPGFYLRVIREGQVAAGDEIVRTRTGPHRLTVAETDALLYLPGRDTARLRDALEIPALSPGWQASFRDLLDPARPSQEEIGWEGFKPLRVTRIVPESASVASIHLSSTDGTPLPQARPGQYLALRVTGAAEPPPVRTYSLSGSPSTTQYRISVKREPHGTVSGYLQTRLQVGDTLQAAAPRGEFVLPDDAADTSPVLLVSAGIGATPVLAMLHALAAGASSREIWWLHTSRSQAEQPFAAESHQLLTSLKHGHERICYTAPLASGAVPQRLNRDSLAALDLPVTASAYLCGPGAFIDDMRTALIDLGLPEGRIHAELFTTLPAINPGLTSTTRTPPHQPPGPNGAGPQITFTRSGLTAAWDQRYASLLELAEACDVPTRWACRTGVCHTCQTPVLSGAVRYSPNPLESPEVRTTLLCCAQPSTDLILDL